MPYIAFHVDLSGAALASYELKAADDDTAKIEAREYLRMHPSIEIWNGPRRIARLARDVAPPRIRGH